MPDADRQAAEAALTAQLDQLIAKELDQHQGNVSQALACLRAMYVTEMRDRPAFDARHLGGVADGLKVAHMVVEAAATRTALAAMTDPTRKEDA